MGGHVIVMTTVSSEDEGAKIAHELVGRRLAACVNVSSPVRSVYRWKGKVEEATERVLMIKTLRENVDRVKEAIGKLHSYELPEVVAVPIEAGDETYLNWLAAMSAEVQTELP